MTQQEITALKNQVWENYFNGDATEPCTIKLLDSALERLEKLEAAVAWHGFDEVPEADPNNAIGRSRGVELLSSCGDVAAHELWYYHKETDAYERYAENIFDEDEEVGRGDMMERGYHGWRYPVGDLG